MNLTQRKLIQFLLTLLISGFFMFLAIRSVDFKKVFESIHEVNILLLFLGLCIWLCSYLVRAYRWLKILANNVHIKYLTLVKIIFVGFMGNNLLPLRAGEFVQAYLVNYFSPNISKSGAFATVVVNRIFDGLAVVIYTLIGALALTLPDWARKTVVFGMLFFVGIFVFLLFLSKIEFLFQLVVNIINSIFPKKISLVMNRLLDNFRTGLHIFHSFRQIITALLLSFGVWGIEVIFYFLVCQAFHFPVTLLKAAFVMGVINLGVMIPTAPGGVGTFQFIAIQAFLVLGIAESQSLGFALIAQFLQNTSVIVLGVLSLLKLGLSFNVFREAENE